MKSCCLVLAAFIFLATSAVAQQRPTPPQPPPIIDPNATVTLTYAELSALINKAIANSNPLAASAEEKLKAALVPKPSKMP